LAARHREDLVEDGLAEGGEMLQTRKLARANSVARDLIKYILKMLC
jgi:hypothetical protein